MHDLLFANQHELEDEHLKSYADFAVGHKPVC